MLSDVKRFTPAGVLVFVTLALMSFVEGVYVNLVIEQPAIYGLLVKAAELWVVSWWLLDDSRRRGVQWVYDMGFFLALAWPFIILYYLFKTRGVRALLTIGAFAVVCLIAATAGAVATILLAY